MLYFWGSINRSARDELLENLDSIEMIYGQSLNLTKSLHTVSFGLDELHKFIDRSYRSKLKYEHCDTFEKVCLDYELG